MKRVTWFLLTLLLAHWYPVLPGPMPGVAVSAVLRYLSPSDGARYVPPASTIALRLDGAIAPESLSTSFFRVTGSVSGLHSGRLFVADDNATVIFRPDWPFTAGEHVVFTITDGLRTRAGAVFPGLSAGFAVSAGGVDRAAAMAVIEKEDEQQLPSSSPVTPQGTAVHPQNYKTFPSNFPVYTVTVPASATAPGLLFMGPLSIAGGPSFLSVMDDTGEPVYWQAAAAGKQFFDLKKQANGQLTYFSNSDYAFHVLDNTYTQVRTFGAANGYIADAHELQLLPNGHSLFMIYDPIITDTRSFGGSITATVIGLVIQELDTNNQAVFQWSSWDHIPITDTYEPLNTPQIDYMHGNALELDNDGNILLSSRHLSEITKINRTGINGNIGDIIWRLGGKANQFTVTDMDGPFSYQHDIRRLPNGDITLFDNHNLGPDAYSRAVEYQIDENAKVVTETWEYRNFPDIVVPFTGNNQRLPDGHRLIDWGFGHPNVTEVLTDGTTLFEMTFSPAYFSYRAFRFPWAATPAWDPTLVVITGTVPPTLYYSWNGATDVASYEIYGGVGPTPTTLLGTQTRTGFEDHTPLTGVPGAFCSFRIRPIDHEAQPQRFSNVVYTSQPCFFNWLPVFHR